MSKEEIRQKILSLRNSLTDKEVKALSRSIISKLIPILTKYQTIFTYISKVSEVETKTLIMGINKSLLVPYMKSGEIKVSKLNSLQDTVRGPYNILEPRVKKEVDINSADIAIIPGVVFDVHGNRLGYGKGYFDKLLRNARPLKVGLAYECQIVDKLPVKPHDVPMDLVITENRVIKRVLDKKY